MLASPPKTNLILFLNTGNVKTEHPNWRPLCQQVAVNRVMRVRFDLIISRSPMAAK